MKRLLFAMSLGLAAFGLSRLKKIDSLENPARFGYVLDAESALEALADVLMLTNVDEWTWSIVNKNDRTKALKAECSAGDKAKEPIWLTARVSDSKYDGGATLKYKVHALVNRKELDRVVDKTTKAIKQKIDDVFESWMRDTDTSIEVLLELARENEDNHCKISAQQMSLLTAIIKEKAAPKLKPGDRIKHRNYFVARDGEGKIMVGRARAFTSQRLDHEEPESHDGDATESEAKKKRAKTGSSSGNGGPDNAERN